MTQEKVPALPAASVSKARHVSTPHLLMGPICAAVAILAACAASMGAADELDGDGSVIRTVLTHNQLTTGAAPSSPVDEQAFAVPENAAMPQHLFEGRLRLLDVQNGQFVALVDPYGFGTAAWSRLPALDVELVQTGSHLVPAQRGLITDLSSHWWVIVEPGRVWQENGDQGMSRASLPFNLMQRNENCVHNGVLTFLFDDTRISGVWAQVTQETCLYFKADYWGRFEAEVRRGGIDDADRLRSDFAEELARRYPTAPFGQLAVDYPGIDLLAFTSDLNMEHVTLYGLVINGVNYVGGCQTRYGASAYCGQLRMPSYSTAKSLFAGVALMRLTQKYGDEVPQLLIRDYMPEASQSRGDWSSVTFNNALDMATGNFSSAGYMVDEDGEQMFSFFTAESFASKIANAFDWPRALPPNNEWVYRTSDTFILGTAMQRFLHEQEGPEADIFELVVDEVYKPVGVGPGAHTTMRTSDNAWHGQPITGYGLFWTADDVAKLSTFVNINQGRLGTTQVLHRGLLDGAMQWAHNDPGPPTAWAFRYNNGFWARHFDADAVPEYGREFWVPHMVGWGGIIVALLPNGATYYYFNDNDDFAWSSAAIEAMRIRPLSVPRPLEPRRPSGRVSGQTTRSHTW